MAGMSDMIVPIIVLCVCLVSCAVSSMAMGSFKNMFSGIFGGIGSLFSGDLFKPRSLEKVGTFKEDDFKPATKECDEECQKAGAMLRVFARAPKKL
jgi:hypothetical protein